MTLDDAATALLAYVREKMRLNTETKERVTANPLMLSMMASVYELRRGVDMPSTVAALYETASGAMLARGGAGASDSLRQLLERTFFEAHTAQRRVIDDWQLDEAALGLEAPEELARIRERAVATAPFEPYEGRAEVGHFVEVNGKDDDGKEYKGKRGVITKVWGGSSVNVTFGDGTTSGSLEPTTITSSGLDEAAIRLRAMPASAAELRSACAALPEATRDALSEVRRRVAFDELPLLSLLQASPLQVQSSHLSFQEYFAACALCEGGTVLSGVPPWQWPAWWANTVAIGAEMGESFGRGLLSAACVTGDTLDLSGKMGGDRPTVLRVIVAMLQGGTALTSVNLLRNKIGEAAIDIVRAAEQHGKIQTLCGIKPDQKEADFSHHGLEAADAVLLAYDIKVNTPLTKLTFGDRKAVALDAAAESMDLSHKSIDAGGAMIIAAFLPRW